MKTKSLTPNGSCLPSVSCKLSTPVAFRVIALLTLFLSLLFSSPAKAQNCPGETVKTSLLNMSVKVEPATRNPADGYLIAISINDVRDFYAMDLSLAITSPLSSKATVAVPPHTCFSCGTGNPVVKTYLSPTGDRLHFSFTDPDCGLHASNGTVAVIHIKDPSGNIDPNRISRNAIGTVMLENISSKTEPADPDVMPHDPMACYPVQDARFLRVVWGDREPTGVWVHDLSGRTLAHLNQPSGTQADLDLQGASAGIYLVRVVDPRGGVTARRVRID